MPPLQGILCPLSRKVTHLTVQFGAWQGLCFPLPGALWGPSALLFCRMPFFLPCFWYKGSSCLGSQDCGRLGRQSSHSLHLGPLPCLWVQSLYTACFLPLFSNFKSQTQKFCARSLATPYPILGGFEKHFPACSPESVGNKSHLSWRILPLVAEKLKLKPLQTLKLSKDCNLKKGFKSLKFAYPH